MTYHTLDAFFAIHPRFWCPTLFHQKNQETTAWFACLKTCWDPSKGRTFQWCLFLGRVFHLPTSTSLPPWQETTPAPQSPSKFVLARVHEKNKIHFNTLWKFNYKFAKPPFLDIFGIYVNFQGCTVDGWLPRKSNFNKSVLPRDNWLTVFQCNQQKHLSKCEKNPKKKPTLGQNGHMREEM